MPLARLDSGINGSVDARTKMLLEEVRIRFSKRIHYVPSRLVWISIGKGNPVSD